MSVPKNESPATAPLSPIVKTSANGCCARKTASVPPVAAPRSVSAPVAFVTRRGESGSIAGVRMMGGWAGEWGWREEGRAKQGSIINQLHDPWQPTHP